MRHRIVTRSEIDASPGKRLDAEYYVTDPTVSRRMSAQKTEGTGPEIRLRRLARSLGLSYRCNRKNISGRPDLSNKSNGKWMVFVNGCYWHAHGHLPLPVGFNARYWDKKFRDNRARDARWIRAHRKCGWNVAVVWECWSDERILRSIRWVARRAV